MILSLYREKEEAKLMKRFYQVLTIVLVSMLVISSSALAHPGRLDANGGHNCSEKSKQKGLCTGYHYHRGEKAQPKKSTKKSTSSKANSKSTSKSTSSTSKATTKTTTVKETKKSYKTSKLKLFYNGKEQKLQTAAIEVQGITYYPIREISQIIGATLSVDKDNNIILKKDKNTVTLADKSSQIVIVDGKKYAPIRAIVEKLGITVTYKKQEAAIYLQE